MKFVSMKSVQSLYRACMELVQGFLYGEVKSACGKIQVDIIRRDQAQIKELGSWFKRKAREDLERIERIKN